MAVAEKIPRFLLEMLKSIFSSDFYIFIAAVVTAILIPRITSVRSTIIRKLDKMPNNPDWAAEVRAKLGWWYTFFLTMISVFPLLGMFGTVAALLNLDFSDIAGSLDNVKTDFFHALTSTAWGIVFSVLFKLLNAWLFYDIEDIYEEIDNVVRENKLAAQERLYAAKSAVQDSRNDIYSGLDGLDDLSLPEEYNFEKEKDNYYEN